MYIYCTFYTHYTYTRYRLYNYTYYDMHPYNMKLYICKYTQNNINRERESGHRHFPVACQDRRAGWASDKYGRRPVLLIAIAGTTASTVLTGCAWNFAIMCCCPDWSHQSHHHTPKRPLNHDLPSGYVKIAVENGHL